MTDTGRPEDDGEEHDRPTRPARMHMNTPSFKKSSTAYIHVDRMGSGIEHLGNPPVITRIRAASDDARGTCDERITADLTEQAANALLALPGAMPEDFFYCLYSLLQSQFAKERAADPGFLSVRYLVPPPPGSSGEGAKAIVAYDVPFAEVSWTDLQQEVSAHPGPGPDADGPRGIHFVHEPNPRLDGRGLAGGGAWPAFSMDVGIDGRGSIVEATADLEMWMGFTVSSPGPEGVEASLKYASGLMLDFVQCLVRLAETLENPIPRDSSLVDFFFLLDSMRTSDPRNHAPGPALVPAGEPLYEFEADARFRGRELKVTVADSTGFLQRMARDMCDTSRRIVAPLRGFSVVIAGDGRTVMLERRYSDMRVGPPAPARLPPG